MKPQAIRRIAALMIAASGLLRAQPASDAPPYSALYVFGDSWSGTTDGPYWRSRWSNGPMWPETLSTNWGLSYVAANNYAKGGATTSDVVGTQVPRFTGSSNAPTALFVVWAAGNDLWNYLVVNNTLNSRALTNTVGCANLFKQMTRNLSNTVVRLHQKGARTVIVIELDELQRAPGFPHLTDTQAIQLRDQVQAYNRALEETLAALDASIPNLRLLRPGFHDRWNEFLDQAVNLGFTRTDLGALQDPALTDKSQTGPGSDYVFWDANHPTSRTHGVWAGWFGEVATQTRTETLRLAERGDAFDLELAKLKPGREYTVEVSEDLSTWTAQESFTAVEGTNTLTFSASPDGLTMRLSRLRWSD